MDQSLRIHKTQSLRAFANCARGGWSKIADKKTVKPEMLCREANIAARHGIFFSLELRFLGGQSLKMDYMLQDSIRQASWSLRKSHPDQITSLPKGGRHMPKGCLTGS